MVEFGGPARPAPARPAIRQCDVRRLRIAAAPRGIGLRLPVDELVVEQSLLVGALSAAGQEYALRAHTLLSGVKVAVRLRRIVCAL